MYRILLKMLVVFFIITHTTFINARWQNNNKIELPSFLKDTSRWVDSVFNSLRAPERVKSPLSPSNLTAFPFREVITAVTFKPRSVPIGLPFLLSSIRCLKVPTDVSPAGKQSKAPGFFKIGLARDILTIQNFL